MKEITVTADEGGQRLDKYLRRKLPAAGTSFLYRMLRKKNIVLNGRKADGSEHIVAGDTVALFFSDETFEKLSAKETGEDPCLDAYRETERKYGGIRILYEDRHFLLADKPAGLLAQKSEADDISLNEWFIGYLLRSGQADPSEFSYYRPSVCNRLDRNTSGIMLLAKTLPASRAAGRVLKDRTLKKYYRMLILKRSVEDTSLMPAGLTPGMSGVLEGYLEKDPSKNKVRVFEGPRDNAVYSKTVYEILENAGNGLVLAGAELVTGRTHQLRAHFAAAGHPIAGDAKYSDPAFLKLCRGSGIRRQLLHSCRVEFPRIDDEPAFEGLSGRVIESPLPEDFSAVLKTGLHMRHQ